MKTKARQVCAALIVSLAAATAMIGLSHGGIHSQAWITWDSPSHMGLAHHVAWITWDGNSQCSTNSKWITWDGGC